MLNHRNKLIVLALFMAILAGFDALIPLMQRYNRHFVVARTTGVLSYSLLPMSVVVAQAIIVKAMISYAGYIETGSVISGKTGLSICRNCPFHITIQHLSDG